MIDGASGGRALLYEWDALNAAPTGAVMPAPPPLRSADGTHEIAIIGSQAVIRRAADGTEWRLETGGAVPTLSADNSWAMYARTGDVALPGEPSPRTTVTISRLDSSETRILADAPGVGAQWLDAERLLLTQRTDLTTNLYVYDAATGETGGLAAFDFIRGLSVAPGGGYLVFYLVFQQDPARNGIYTLATEAGAQPVQAEWFGSYRWRSDHEMYYVPLTPGQPHELWHYDVTTNESLALTDADVTPFPIANGDWTVSADGARIAYWEASDLTTWLLEGVP
jgi:hypothetical protein